MTFRIQSLPAGSALSCFIIAISHTEWLRANLCYSKSTILRNIFCYFRRILGATLNVRHLEKGRPYALIEFLDLMDI